MAEKSKESAELIRIFAEKGGVNNAEFYECVRKFFYFLQHRYIGKRVPEIDGDFWSHLVSSMEYYDPKRSNIVSWTHSIGRNVCASYNYHQGKRNQETSDDLNLIRDDSDDEASVNAMDEWMLSPEMLTKIFQNSKLKVSRVNENFGKTVINAPENNPLKRHIQWETSKLSSM